MALSVRPASIDDMARVAEILRRGRAQRAEWEPELFGQTADADSWLQPYLAGLLDADDAALTVVTSDGEVVGCAIEVKRPQHWVVDDITAADDGWWSDAMVELLRRQARRPAIACVPRKDIRQTGCCVTVNLRHRSSYWRLSLPRTEELSPDSVAEVPAPDQLAPAPVHSFDPVDLGDPDTTVLGDGSGGYAVLAAPVSAPPGYDPGGATGLLERVTGGRRGDLVDAALSAAAKRGDAQLLVVCAEDDPLLEDALVDRGFHRGVDVYVWPTRRA